MERAAELKFSLIFDVSLVYSVIVNNRLVKTEKTLPSTECSLSLCDKKAKSRLKNEKRKRNLTCQDKAITVTKNEVIRFVERINKFDF